MALRSRFLLFGLGALLPAAAFAGAEHSAPAFDPSQLGVISTGTTQIKIEAPEAEPCKLPQKPIVPSGTSSKKEDSGTEEGAEFKKKALALVQQWLSKVPGTSHLLADYMDVVGISSYDDPGQLGASNAGLLSHFKKTLAKDEAVKQRAVAFYDEIRKIDQSIGDLPRPRIGDSSAVGGREPGWLWKLALKHTDGDANLAMQIIGICGHDDVSRSLFAPVKLTSEERNSALALRKSTMRHSLNFSKSRIPVIEERLVDPELTEEERASLAREKIRHIQALNKGEQEIAELKIDAIPEISERNICPDRNSIFLYPKALGKDVEIPQALKDRVIDTQSSTVPAKQYHILGSAAVTCELIGRGHNPGMIKFIEQAASMAYRTIRMNADVCGRDGDGTVKGDAAQLMARDALGGEKIPFTNIHIPQTNLRVEMPQFLDKFGPTRMMRKPIGWSDKRYDAALKKMKSLWTDWEWTRKQHEVGAQFAIDHCKKK